MSLIYVTYHLEADYVMGLESVIIGFDLKTKE